MKEFGGSADGWRPMDEARSRLRQLAVQGSCLAAMIAGTLGGAAGAQQGGLAAAREPAYHLHVYEDLVKVPTLVLSWRFQDVPGLTAGDFTIRLDSGPSFTPRNVRREGDDPLTVGLLLDVSGGVAPDVLEDLRRSLPAWAAASFSKRDRLLIYAVDCGLFRASQVFMPVSPRIVAEQFDAVLGSAGLHGQGKAKAGCGAQRHLWDAMAAVAAELGTQPGRRVLLSVTDGLDHASVDSWEQLREYAGDRSVAIFALRPTPPPVKDGMPTEPARLAEVPLVLLCAGSGGTVLGLSSPHTLVSLERAVGMVRDRYVLYFPRPAKGEEGQHRIDASIRDRSAIVRPVGVVFPAHNNAQQTGQGTVPSDPSRTPAFGTRRPLQTAGPP